MEQPYKQAIERSTIPRVPWRFILGTSLTAYLRDNKFRTNDELMSIILLKVRDKLTTLKNMGWSFHDINKNLIISLSARRAEQKIYSNERRVK
jgi:hypothetical protein